MKHVIIMSIDYGFRKMRYSPVGPFQRSAEGWPVRRLTHRYLPTCLPSIVCEDKNYRQYNSQIMLMRHRIDIFPCYNMFDNRSLASATRTHLSRCSRHIRSFATFSFFETSFLRCSTVFLPFKLMEKLPPVVVCIFSVMSVVWDEPHPYTSVPVARSMVCT